MRIAVLVCSMVFDSQKAFMKGIEKRVRDWQDTCAVFCCHVNIAGNDSYARGEYSIFDLPDLSTFDGIVFVRNTFYDDGARSLITEKINSLRIPCVSIDSYSPYFVNIMSDERQIMESITRHLVEVHDCKKIYFLGGQSSSNDTSLRFDGFMNVLNEHGLEFKPEWRMDGDFEYSSGIEAANYFLGLSTDLPDAIACCNDEMAIGLISELKRKGIKVPKDIKVTGVDYDSVSRVYTPRITTAKRQQYQKGANAINVLHEFNEHNRGETITLPVSLFCGNSCGCKAEDNGQNDATTINTLGVDKYSQSELIQVTRRMSADLMGRRNYYDLYDELKEYGCKLKPDELYLCMNVRPEYLIDYSDYSKSLSMIDRDNEEGYSAEIINTVSIIDGQIPKNDDREYFERHNLFPPIACGGKPGGTYYFLPIHYINRNFGYAILGTSGELIRNDFFPNWCTIVSNAFENTRKRMVMEQMISALDHMWIYDTLTGIYNRAGFFKLSENIVSEAIKKQTPICVVFLDVDGLKEVNDKFGHDEGDSLIKGIADVMKDCKRHGEIIMRYGGDEFVLLASGYSKEEADACINRLEVAMQRKNDSEQKPYTMEASIGYHITTLKDPAELNSLIEEADHEMYKKKYVKKALNKKSMR